MVAFNRSINYVAVYHRNQSSDDNCDDKTWYEINQTKFGHYFNDFLIFSKKIPQLANHAFDKRPQRNIDLLLLFWIIFELNCVSTYFHRKFFGNSWWANLLYRGLKTLRWTLLIERVLSSLGIRHIKRSPNHLKWICKYNQDFLWKTWTKK